MPTKKWKDTVWGDPLDPDYEIKRKARMSTRELRAAREIEEEEYQHARIALAMGAPTVHEKALLDFARKAMFAHARKIGESKREIEIDEGSDCIDAALADLIRITTTLPIPLERIEAELERIWSENQPTVADRLAALPRHKPGLMERLRLATEHRITRLILRGDWFKFQRKGVGSYMMVKAHPGYAKPPVIDNQHPQVLDIGTDFLILSRNENVRRFGQGTLLLRADHDNPGHYWMLRSGRYGLKRIAYVRETTRASGNKPTFREIKTKKGAA